MYFSAEFYSAVLLTFDISGRCLLDEKHSRVLYPHGCGLFLLLELYWCDFWIVLPLVRLGLNLAEFMGRFYYAHCCKARAIGHLLVVTLLDNGGVRLQEIVPPTACVVTL